MKRDPRKAFESKLLELGERDKRILALSCDSASGGGLGSFFKEFPQRSVEIGISEQCGVDIAAALSMQGFCPVLVVINPFLTMRAFEQIRNDIGYMNTNVKIVGSGGGLAYSTLGSSHIAIEDIALMRSVPNLTIYAPGDADEVEFYLERAIEEKGPVYIRMPRQARALPIAKEERRLAAGKAEVLRNGENALLLTYGPSAEEALKAAGLLSDLGMELTVLNMTTLKPLDDKAVLYYAARAELVITLEEHAATGGLGTAVAELMAANALSVPLMKFAIPDGSKMTGPYEELVDYYGLSGQRVASKIAQYYTNKIV